MQSVIKRRLLAVAGAFACVVLSIAPSGATDVQIGVRVGNSSVQVSPDGVRARINLGSTRSKFRNRQGSVRGNRGRNGSGLRSNRRFNPTKNRTRPLDRIILIPERERQSVIRADPIAPTRPDPVEQTPLPAPPQPELLDPAGKSRILSARGRSEQPIDFGPGDILPADVPHVTLNARRYDLPDPPSGEIYARVRQSVLRINAATREVVAVFKR